MRKLLYAFAFLLLATVSFSQETISAYVDYEENIFLTRGTMYETPRILYEDVIDKNGYCLYTRIAEKGGKEYNFPTLVYFTKYEGETARQQREKLLQSYNILFPKEGEKKKK